jgi:arginine:ornithine antiporter/lysine permease
MITAEIPYAAAKDGTFPKIFGSENSKGTPSVSLWITSILMQLAMLLVYFSNNAWNTMLSITGVMVLPAYLASTAYLWKISERKELFSENKNLQISTRCALFSGIFGVIFSIWLIYAAGLQYLLMSIIFLALGIPVYVWSRKERMQKAFTKAEMFGASVVAIVAIIAVSMISSGVININENGSSSTPSTSESSKKKSKKDEISTRAPMTKRHGENAIIIIESEEIFY